MRKPQADDERDFPRIHFWEVDDDDVDDPDEDYHPDPPPELGPCCVCGTTGETVRNIMMLNKRAPTPGYGWACFQCGLPPDGAIAVLCDGCLEANAKITHICDGYPAEGKRVPLDLSAPDFDHDMSKHPEAQGD